MSHYHDTYGSDYLETPALSEEQFYATDPTRQSKEYYIEYDDVHNEMNYGEYIDAIKRMGFIEYAIIPFPKLGYGSEAIEFEDGSKHRPWVAHSSIREEQFFFTNPKLGLIIIGDTFTYEDEKEVRVNSANLSYCFSTDKFTRRPPHLTSSGGVRGVERNTWWEGHHDARQGVGATIKYMQEHVEYLKAFPSGIDRSIMLWNHSDGKGLHENERVDHLVKKEKMWERYKTLPREFQSIMNWKHWR